VEYDVCRGSPCTLPEETLAGYEAAIDAGVDYVEMDAVCIVTQLCCPAAQVLPTIQRWSTAV